MFELHKALATFRKKKSNETAQCFSLLILLWVQMTFGSLNSVVRFVLECNVHKKQRKGNMMLALTIHTLSIENAHIVRVKWTLPRKEKPKRLHFGKALTVTMKNNSHRKVAWADSV